MADRQHGVVSLSQLRAIGLSDRTVRGWVAAGRLQRLHQGVFAVGHQALRPEGRWLAAVMACGPGAVLSHASAGALHDLRTTAAARTDVTAPGRRGRSRPGIRLHSGNRLHPDEVGVVAGIPCTTVPRTILDLAAVVDRRGLERVCERAVRIEVFDLFALNRLRARHAGQRGVARLQAVLAEWDDELVRTRSELEVLFFRLVVDAGIRRPLVNREVRVGDRAFEADFHWPEARLVVETDSRAFHDNPLARKRDAERDRILRGAGWSVERFRSPDVTTTRDRTIGTVRAYLDRPAAAAS
jgi:very-short-patch-repair endonuclease